MDRDVYTNEIVAAIVSKDFISIKVQMDTTKNDNDLIKKWYQDAHLINTQYSVNEYPTYLFFSPQGELVHKGLGYQRVPEFISLTQQALNPDRQYVALINKYKREEKNFPIMKDLARKAMFLMTKNLLRKSLVII